MDMNTWLDTLPEDLLERLGDCSPEIIQKLVGLNPQQLRATTEIEGPIQINAVAGSGKTRVLTHRIAYMRSLGIKANNIFCTTFTKKATTEMTERLSKLVPPMYLQQMTLGTTHSIGYRILSKEYKAMNHHLAGAFKSGKDILMNTDQRRFMEDIKKTIMKDYNVPFEIKQELNEIAVPQFMKAIGLSKNEGIDNVAYEMKYADTRNNKMLAYILFYNRYEQRKWSEQVIDGDDLLFLLWKLLRENPDVLAKYRRIYKYFLVDETQDNNDIQYDLLTMLAYPENNIFVVGDDDQSMYGFRGAQPKNFIEFKKRFPSAILINLEDNYRSKPGILDIANKLISNNTERLIKELRANKKDNSESHSYSHYQDEMEEALGVVSEIKHLTETEGVKHKGITILYRTNAQSRAFEDQLIQQGLPYVIHGGISFYERREVKDIVAYLQMIVNPSDVKCFERIYNVPKRYLGKVFLDKVKTYNGTPWQAINDSKFYSSLTYEKNGVDSLKTTLAAMSHMHKNGSTPAEIIDYLITEGGYEKYLTEDGDEEDEGNSRMENVNTLKYAINRFSKVEDFLEYITVLTTTAKIDINGVQLMTIHKSKGLEFPVAFVVGLSEGLLPHFKSVEDAESGVKPLAVEEERRLCYVAVTRAESFVYLSSLRMFNGRGCVASRFVSNMELKAKAPTVVPVAVEAAVEVSSELGELTLEQTLDMDYDRNIYEDLRREKQELSHLLNYKD